jgi:hypothetical protein
MLLYISVATHEHSPSETSNLPPYIMEKEQIIYHLAVYIDMPARSLYGP